MLGDQNDMRARIKAVLPPQWFPDTTPILDGLLAGLGAGWAGLYSLLDYVKRQTRIATAADVFLDIVARDFFGSRIVRSAGQADNAFRSRILPELLRERDTRSALISALSDLTGLKPLVFEPARTTDTGGWGVALAYEAAGGWGSLALPFQCFVTALRPIGGGIANVNGYGSGSSVPSWAPGAVTARQASATYIDQNGAMQTAGPGVVRPNYVGGVLQGLLLEAASTNEVRNGNASGAGPGVLPTDWFGGGGAGVTMTVVGGGVSAGLSYVDVRFSGTATSTTTLGIQFGLQTDIAALPAQTWDYSLFPGLAAGTLSGVYAVGIQIVEYNSGMGVVAAPAITFTPTNAILTAQRQSFSFVTPAATAYLWPTWYFGVTSGAAIDATFRFAGIQVEQSSAATSYIPTSGTAATRDADAVSNTQPGTGGYGGLAPSQTAGAIEYADLVMVQAQVSDGDIDAVIAATMPVATIAWTRITN